MRKLIILSILLSVFKLVNAQDVLTKRDGTDIQAKVLEVTTGEVKYKKFDNINGPTFSILKSDLLMVRYENGTKDIFNQQNTNSVANTNFNSTPDDNTCFTGKQDALRNYSGQNSGAGWTMATTILTSPLLGLIPAVACSSSAPLDENLKCPNPNLIKDNNYYRCYKDQALETKKKKIWTNYGIGAGVWLAIIVLASM